MNTVLSILIGYVIGSLNFSYILGKLKGIDIRTVNSKNPGAANAKLTFGWWAFVVVWLCDTLKAVAAYYLIGALFKEPEYLKYVGTAFVVVGHCYPLFMQLKGGKGFSSFGGVALAFGPLGYLIAFGIGVVVTLLSNSLALLTLVSLIACPIILYFIGGSITAVLALSGAALFTCYRHLHNFKDLFNGEEAKIILSKPGIQDFFLKIKTQK